MQQAVFCSDLYFLLPPEYPDFESFRAAADAAPAPKEKQPRRGRSSRTRQNARTRKEEEQPRETQIQDLRGRLLGTGLDAAQGFFGRQGRKIAQLSALIITELLRAAERGSRLDFLRRRKGARRDQG